jgi:hypothetical protein
VTVTAVRHQAGAAHAASDDKPPTEPHRTPAGAQDDLTRTTRDAPCAQSLPHIPGTGNASVPGTPGWSSSGAHGVP